MSDAAKMLAMLKEAKNISWPFEQALKILEKIDGKLPKKGYVLFETGYGPSGLPHIGTFAEVARTTMVRNAFSKICDFPTKLYCFSDDMDGLRKIPSNLPNQQKIAQFLDRPLTDVPDPFEQEESFGHYMNKKLRSFLDAFGFEYGFQSATQWYKGGKFDHMMVKALQQHQAILDIMLPTLGVERQQTYSPFLPICPQTGKVLQVKISDIDVEKATVSYLDGDAKVTVPVTAAGCKLQWKPDFGMRWAALDVDYEMYGKDHMPNAQIYSQLCELLGGTKPVQFFYELFLDETGQKISKSKGNSISLDDWLKYAPLESLALFMYNSPTKAKRLYFDVIPKAVDEYIIFNEKYHQASELEKKIHNPVYHIHNGDVPKLQTYGLSFTLLLNLACACNPENKDVLWGFISKYAPGSSRENSSFLDQLADFAITYYNDFIKAKKVYRIPNEQDVVTLKLIAAELEKFNENVPTEEIQNMLYDIARNICQNDLKIFFSNLYSIILGQNDGPKLGSFIKLYGIIATQKLIKGIIDQKK